MNSIVKKIVVPVMMVMLVVFPSCIGDNFELDKLSTKVQLQSSWIFPIAYGSMTVEDIAKIADSVADNHLVPNDSNLVIIRLQDTMMSQTAEDLITLMNQTFTMQFNKTDYDSAGGFAPTTVVMTKHETEYPFGVVLGQLLDSMVFDSNKLRIRVNSNMPNRGQLIMTFPELRKNGNSYVRMIYIEPQGNSYSYDHTFTDLEGYVLDLTKANSGVNSLFINYTLALRNEGSQPFNPEHKIDIQIDFNDNEYSWLFGYVGPFENELGPSKIDLGFTNEITSGAFYVEAPVIRFIISNSFGIPTKYGFDYVNVHNKRLGRVDPLTGNVPFFDVNPEYLVLPVNSYPYSLVESTDTVEVFGELTNLPQLLYDLPSSIEYVAKINLNPTESGTQRNFMSKNSKISVVSQLDVPFWGRTPNICFVDTVDFDTGSDTTIFNYFKKIQVKLDITNGFPHDIRLQGILTDVNYTYKDSIFGTPEEQVIIESGIVMNGVVTSKTKKTTVIEVTKDRFDKWKGSKYMILRAFYNTTLPSSNTQPQESVLYYRHYGVDVKVTAKAEVEIEEHL